MTMYGSMILIAQKSFEVINIQMTWPLDAKSIGQIFFQMGSLCVKCHENMCKGKAIMIQKPRRSDVPKDPIPHVEKDHTQHPIRSMHMQLVTTKMYHWINFN